MPSLKIVAFDGISPRHSPTLLGDNQAQVASNVKLFSGEVRPWRGSSLAYTPALLFAHTIYRLRSGSFDAWLTWLNDVDVAPGPVADTTEGRVYYTGDGSPRKTNYALATTGGGPYPHAYMEMGVPSPTVAPTVTNPIVGTGTTETRAYVYTLVNDFGTIREEGAPSPAATITVPGLGSTVRVALAAPPAGNYNFTARRIYRSVAGATTSSYQFVAEVPIATSFYDDALTTLQLGAVMTSLTYKPPPAALSGVVAIPGTGSLAGFVGNTIYFSEPYLPHAWPLDYAVSVPYNIVGISSFGTTVVVLTDRYPYLLNGGTPGSMALERLDLLEPCISKGSIVTNENGVIYASPNGLVALGPANEGLITRANFTRDEWQALDPAQMKAAIIDGRYLGVFQTGNSQALVFNGYDHPQVTNVDVPATALYVDSQTTTIYYADINDGAIHQLDADDYNPLPFQWLSKRFIVPRGSIMSLMKVDANFALVQQAIDFNTARAALIVANQALFANPLQGAMNEVPVNTFTLNGSILHDVPSPAATRYVTINVFSDGVQVASVSPLTMDPFRLPPFKGREIEVQILGNVDVRSVQMATTIGELASG